MSFEQLAESRHPLIEVLSHLSLQEIGRLCTTSQVVAEFCQSPMGKEYILTRRVQQMADEVGRVRRWPFSPYRISGEIHRVSPDFWERFRQASNRLFTTMLLEEENLIEPIFNEVHRVNQTLIEEKKAREAYLRRVQAGARGAPANILQIQPPVPQPIQPQILQQPPPPQIIQPPPPPQILQPQLVQQPPQFLQQLPPGWQLQPPQFLQQPPRQ